MVPLTKAEVDQFLETFDNVPEDTNRDQFMTLFNTFVKAAKTLKRNIYHIFKAGENWLDHLVGFGANVNVLDLIPHVVDDVFCTKELNLAEWMEFVHSCFKSNILAPAKI